jgi:hypothetical protein
LDLTSQHWHTRNPPAACNAQLTHLVPAPGPWVNQAMNICRFPSAGGESLCWSGKWGSCRARANSSGDMGPPGYKTVLQLSAPCPSRRHYSADRTHLTEEPWPAVLSIALHRWVLPHTLPCSTHLVSNTCHPPDKERKGFPEAPPNAQTWLLHPPSGATVQPASAGHV